MKRLLKLLSSRIFLTLLLMILQLAIFGGAIYALAFYSIWIYLGVSLGFMLLSLIICLHIINKDINPAFKLAWVFPILALPLFGGMSYILFGRQRISRKFHKKLVKRAADLEAVAGAHFSGENPDEALPPHNAKLSKFVSNASGLPLVKSGETEYYRVGEEYYAALITELKKAEKFIFLEYFIIERGRFWNDVLEILRDKAAQGVDVRLIYDDVGCITTLPPRYYKKLEKIGIKAIAFNQLKPSFDISMNNRTHRKICVIDGKVAFTGGINLADEYINAVERFGHWKDTGMKFTGAACKSFTLMFLSFWSLYSESETVDDFAKFFPAPDEEPKTGYVQPLTSVPNAKEPIIENAFLQMITGAKRYVYISTPYLIIDNEMTVALKAAAKSGVDVRIMMPHIPDKKTVFMISRSFYPVLLEAGVKIYEYTPGFVHAKGVIADDEIAFIGTCNMDYRSFYLHYECGSLLYGTDSIADMKADYESTLNKCHEVTCDEANDVTVFTKIARTILRVFAPML